MRSIGNPKTAGLSGRYKNFVFRQVKGKTIVCMPPKKRDKKAALQPFKAVDEAKATAYANIVSKDKRLMQAYKAKIKPGESITDAAVKEFLQLVKLFRFATGNNDKTADVLLNIVEKYLYENK